MNFGHAAAWRYMLYLTLIMLPFRYIQSLRAVPVFLPLYPQQRTFSAVAVNFAQLTCASPRVCVCQLSLPLDSLRARPD